MIPVGNMKTVRPISGHLKTVRNGFNQKMKTVRTMSVGHIKTVRKMSAGSIKTVRPFVLVVG